MMSIREGVTSTIERQLDHLGTNIDGSFSGPRHQLGEMDPSIDGEITGLDSEIGLQAQSISILSTTLAEKSTELQHKLSIDLLAADTSSKEGFAALDSHFKTRVEMYSEIDAFAVSKSSPISDQMTSTRRVCLVQKQVFQT